jgi:hypothetical protein
VQKVSNDKVEIRDERPHSANRPNNQEALRVLVGVLTQETTASFAAARPFNMPLRKYSLRNFMASAS